MRIATKKGDGGTTGRLFGSRVSKTDPAIQTVGDIDELNAALGLIKVNLSSLSEEFMAVEKIQHALTLLMGEVAAEAERRAEYVEKYDYVKQEDMDWLEARVDKLQDMRELDQQGWVLYGNSKPGAFSDMASKVCRRAERSLLFLKEAEQLGSVRAICVKYLNRLSDYLHLLARYFDYSKLTTN